MSWVEFRRGEGLSEVKSFLDSYPLIYRKIIG